jgi:hypothetical protein
LKENAVKIAQIAWRALSTPVDGGGVTLPLSFLMHCATLVHTLSYIDQIKGH